jgi:hypothetical protein
MFWKWGVEMAHNNVKVLKPPSCTPSDGWLLGTSCCGLHLSPKGLHVEGLTLSLVLLAGGGAFKRRGLWEEVRSLWCVPDPVRDPSPCSLFSHLLIKW